MILPRLDSSPRLLLTLTLAFFAVAAGCPATETLTPDGGATTDAGTPDAGPAPIVPVAAADFFDELMGAQCRAFARCQFPNRLVYADDADCRAVSATDTLNNDLFDAAPQLKAALASGDVTLDGERARACLDAIADHTDCDDLFEDAMLFTLEPACDAVFTGQRANGGGCAVDEACPAASFCARPNDAVCTGTCTPRGEGTCEVAADCTAGQRCIGGQCGAPGVVGSPCASQADCAASLVCPPSRRSTCTAVPALGEPCSALCADGLVCQSGEAGATCVPLPKDGASCLASGLLCSDGLACRFNVPAPACRSLPVDGEPCTPGYQLCAPNHTCDTSDEAAYTCRSDFAPIDADCSARPCAPGLFCTQGTQAGQVLCRPLPTVGEPCPNLRCADRLICLRDTESVVCGAPSTAGGRCERDSECAVGLYCLVGVCTPVLPENAECDPNGTSCGAGLLCVQGERYTCRRFPGVGEPCDGRCATGAYCFTTEPTASMLTCGAPPGVGERCQARLCAAGAYCPAQGADPVCVAIGDEGDTCNPAEYQACGTGLHCTEGVTGPAKCLAWKRLGESCTETFACGGAESSFFCLDGKCAPRPKPGAPCAIVGEAALCDPFSGWCDPSGETKRCQPFLAGGAECGVQDLDRCGYAAGLGYCRGTCVSTEVALCQGEDG